MLDFLKIFASLFEHGDHEEDEASLSIQDGWLSTLDPEDYPVHHYESPMSSPLVTPCPLALVNHWTATGPGTAKRIAKRWTKYRRQRPASAHVIIAKDGTIYQCVPFTRGAWHCGRKEVELEKGVWLRANHCAVGLEFENRGEVRHIKGDYWCQWPFDERKKFKDYDPVHVNGKHYDRITSQQLLSASEIYLVLSQEYGMPYENMVHQHGDLDPDRKSDAGPNWRDTGLMQQAIDIAKAAEGNHEKENN